MPDDHDAPVALTGRAQRQVQALVDHYLGKDRPEAVRRLVEAVRQAQISIAADPGAGAAFPRPYPSVRGAGHRWVKSGRYWIAYRPTRDGLVITNVFYDTANVVRRLSRR